MSEPAASRSSFEFGLEITPWSLTVVFQSCNKKHSKNKLLFKITLTVRGVFTRENTLYNNKLLQCRLLNKNEVFHSLFVQYNIILLSIGRKCFLVE